jgi:exodeoxyribonuclease V alpha subunit
MSNSTEYETSEYEVLDYQLADLIEQLNTKKNSQLRQATLEISKRTREGHIALLCDTDQANDLLTNKVVGAGEDYKPLTLDNNFIYLRRYWSYQQRLAELITARFSFDCKEIVHQKWIKQRLKHYFSADSNDHSTEINWQQTAAALALVSPFLIISGGPGTGKPTTITRILALLIEQHQSTKQQKPLRVSLAAPTGKAAMRMSESIRESIEREGNKLSAEIKDLLPKESSTIHRLLGYIPNNIEFRFNKKNHLATDIVIVDEASMIDLALMTKLFEAIPPHAKVILLGDKNQLSSVETGSVFTDLCALANNQYCVERVDYLQAVTGDTVEQHHAQTNSSLIDDYIVCLLKSWRFDDASGIGKLSSAVNQGDVEGAIKTLANKDFTDINLLSPLLPALTVHSLIDPWQYYLNALKEKSTITQLFATFNSFRILSALRKGLTGCTYLNIQLEKQLSQQKKLYTGKRWYHGRPIMISENSYRTGLFNGDIGITLYNRDSKETKVWFQTNEGEKAFSPVRLPQHETAWVMTIHKSQGSEFERVLMILPTEDTRVLTRQLIYTGITRAKKRLEIMSNESILNLGVKREIQQATQIRSVLGSSR